MASKDWRNRIALDVSIYSQLVLKFKIKLIHPPPLSLAANPYIILRHRGKVIKSHCQSETLNPIWENLSAVFYHKKMNTPIQVEVCRAIFPDCGTDLYLYFN